MANFDLDVIMDRLVEMEKESLNVGTSVDAVKYFPYTQESFPYWTNRITGMTPTWMAQDVVIYAFDVTARLVIAHYTEGYRGEVAEDAYDFIVEILDYFSDRALMNSNASTTPLDHIWVDDEEDGGLEIVDIIGPAAFANAGIATIQVGIDVLFRLPIIDSVY